MKKSALLLFIFLIFLCGSCSNATAEEVQNQPEQKNSIVRYKLYATQNLWTFIKLDTMTGQMWQVQYTVSDEYERFETSLSQIYLASPVNEINGRFELYPTQNMYNFILLDQIDGRTWQVQWSLDENNRGILPISVDAML